MKIKLIILFLFILSIVNAQNYTFSYSNTGRRVALVNSTANSNDSTITINFLDYASNSSELTDVYRRRHDSTAWYQVANNIAAGTQNWKDENVTYGNIYEYQVKRESTWTYNTIAYDAIGYATASLFSDRSLYQGQMILLVADDVVSSLSTKFTRLKSELTSDGWLVNVLEVTKASGWVPTSAVTTIRNQVKTIYDNAPSNDKPKVIFILGHVPMPRSGQGEYSPDGHTFNKGARGFDGYYADIDGVYTDVDTYNPGGLTSSLQINLPDDYKWDQEYFSSDAEMAYGRVDFADLIDVSGTEMELMEIYLDKLSNYRNVSSGWKMGDKSGFYYGYYPMPNDATFRNLFALSKQDSVYQNTLGTTHPQWVKNNGPFKIYTQNEFVPDTAEWKTYGMDATVYTSDQSSWGFGDVPQATGYNLSRIRALLGTPTKCLITSWANTALNVFTLSGAGMSFGVSMLKVNNYNDANGYYEKPQMDFDGELFWNRTLFAFHGDPTIKLYQVYPPSSLSIDGTSLSWSASPDATIEGYNIYEADSSLGIYNKINTSIVETTSYNINGYEQGNWYMVKAVTYIESGSGTFLSSSLGIKVEGTAEGETTTVREVITEFGNFNIDGNNYNLLILE